MPWDLRSRQLKLPLLVLLGIFCCAARIDINRDNVLDVQLGVQLGAGCPAGCVAARRLSGTCNGELWRKVSDTIVHTKAGLVEMMKHAHLGERPLPPCTGLWPVALPLPTKEVNFHNTIASPALCTCLRLSTDGSTDGTAAGTGYN